MAHAYTIQYRKGKEKPWSKITTFSFEPYFPRWIFFGYYKYLSNVPTTSAK